MAASKHWDDLARDLVDDLYVLSSEDHAVFRILKNKQKKLGLSVTRDFLPAIQRCQATYFARLLWYPTDFDNQIAVQPTPSYVGYMLAPAYQRNDNVGVHELVRLNRSSIGKKGWRRAVDYVDVHPEDKKVYNKEVHNNRVHWNDTTSPRHDSNGSLARLRRADAREEQRRVHWSEPETESQDSYGSLVPLARVEARQEQGPGFILIESMMEDPLRRLKVGEEFANAMR